MNYKRKSRRRFFLLVRSRTPPISSEFRGGLNTPNPPSVRHRIEPRWGRDFPQPSRPVLRPASYTMGTGSLSWGVKRPRRGVDHPPPSNAEAEGSVELYLYSNNGSSWSALGRTLLVPYSLNNKLCAYHTSNLTVIHSLGTAKSTFFYW